MAAVKEEAPYISACKRDRFEIQTAIPLFSSMRCRSTIELLHSIWTSAVGAVWRSSYLIANGNNPAKTPEPEFFCVVANTAIRPLCNANGSHKSNMAVAKAVILYFTASIRD